MKSPLSILQTQFGYSAFRPFQEDIINTVVSGEDALVLMPTGGGKSLCYQIPALVRPGCAIVISPLIALMQNQVDALKESGIEAAYLNSSLSFDDVIAIEQQLRYGTIKLLYIAPERLIQERTLALLQSLPIALFAIDEAHCVSQWGHDFRADYLSLSLLAEQFPNVPRIALTATADRRTRQEIATRLSLQHARQFVSGFDRPNICYRIHLKQNPRQQLLQFLRQHDGEAGIIYCLSRKKTEDTAAFLNDQGFKAMPYHAGLAAATRLQHQNRFLREEGWIVVATIAFGMGIDKPDVRFVAHLDMPKTIEAYYQETGRAGRDGLPAECLMIYGLQDVIKLRQMMEQSQGSDAHKRAEQQRLNAMLGLCEITSCRRQALLHYFDDRLDQPCGNCDTCLEPPATFDGTEAARKALSAAWRSQQHFGVNHLVDILVGNNTDKIQQFEHDQLPTFGVGADMDKNQWRSVFRQLVARGYLSVDLERHGALRLSDQCKDLLQGKEQIALRKDHLKKTAKAQTKTALTEDIDVALWEALRDCRREFAESQGVPPYVIFHDSTLQQMCFHLPRSLTEFAALSGVGQRKLEKYGTDFVAVIEHHINNNSGL